MSDKNDVVMINLDRPRELWFGHKALKTLGALTGKDIDALEMANGMDLEEIEKIVYCGLLKDARAHGETLTLEQMEDLLDYAPYSEIMEKIQLAFQASFGTLVDDPEKNFQRVAAKKKKK